MAAISASNTIPDFQISESRLRVGKVEAAKLEGMMAASRMYLQAVADYIRDTVPEDHRRPFLLKIGGAMAELLDISWALYEMHPDLNPDSAGPHRSTPSSSPDTES